MRRLILSCLLLALASPAQAELVGTGLDPEQVDTAYAPRKLAVVIGVDAYDDPLFPPLSFAAADAEAMGQVLSDPRAGGFDRVTVLTDREQTGLASLQQHLSALLDSAEPQDTVLVYVSAHGTLDLDWHRRADLFVVARDTVRGDLAGTGLRVSDLQELVGTSRARRKVLIVDACHHGQGKSAVSSETLALLAAAKGEAEPVLREPDRDFEAHLFASTFGLPALEDEALGHGVYTHYLLGALSTEASEADRDGDGLVSVSEAHDFARDATIAHTGAVQVPRALYNIVGREDIFLSGDEEARRTAEAALLFTYDAFYGECRVDVDGRYAGLLPRGVPLTPGPHRVRVTAPGGHVVLDRRVDAIAGRAIDVGSLHEATRPERGRVGLALGTLVALGAQETTPLGGPLFGLGLQAGTSFPGERAVRAHVRADLSWHAGRYAVPLEDARFDADVHALSLAGTFGLQLRVKRFGLIVGPRIGASLWLRAPSEDGGPQAPHLAALEPGLLVEPSLSLGRGLALSVPIALSATTDLARVGARPVQLYLRAGAGLTWTVR